MITGITGSAIRHLATLTCHLTSKTFVAAGYRAEMDPDTLASTSLDRLGELVQRAVDAMPDDVRRALGGDAWLGHPLHPALTDLPIGFWTSSWVLDIVGRKRSARTSAAMVGFGVASAVPTIAAGAVDWTQLPEEKKRTGLIHMICMAITTWLYAWSFFARLRGRRGRGILLGMLGAGVATAGGYLGGHLVFGSTDDAGTTEESVAPVTRLAG